jgi:hypothetical protein
LVRNSISGVVGCMGMKVDLQHRETVFHVSCRESGTRGRESQRGRRQRFSGFLALRRQFSPATSSNPTLEREIR